MADSVMAANSIHFDGRRFRVVENSENGEVGPETVFAYHERGDLVWGTYEGGRIRFGVFIARRRDGGGLHMRYQHVNTDGEFRDGTSVSLPETLDDGRVRLQESWLWSDGDRSTGRAVLEEIR
jgi:hypothetical protein